MPHVARGTLSQLAKPAGVLVGALARPGRALRQTPGIEAVGVTLHSTSRDGEIGENPNAATKPN